LPLRKIAHLRLGKLDIIEIAFAHLGDRALDFLWRELERRRRPPVELLRQLTHRPIAPRLDVGQDGFNRRAHLCVGRLARPGIDAAFQIANHACLLISAHTQISNHLAASPVTKAAMASITWPSTWLGRSYSSGRLLPSPAMNRWLRLGNSRSVALACPAS